MKQLLDKINALYKHHGIKKVYSIVDGKYNLFVMKELFRKGNFSFNAGVSTKNIGVSLGYTPKELKVLELHGILANSWKNTIHGKFKPRVGFGISLNF